MSTLLTSANAGAYDILRVNAASRVLKDEWGAALNKPNGLGTASLGLSIAGMLSGAIGSFYSAKSQKSSLRFQADIAQINARLSESAAQQELRKGEHEVGKLTMAAGQLKGKQRARLAANGFDMGQGNAAELQASTDLMKEIDRQQIEENAVRNAWGYRTQATNARTSATMASGMADGISPGMASASSLLGSAGAVADKWYHMKKAGALG